MQKGKILILKINTNLSYRSIWFLAFLSRILNFLEFKNDAEVKRCLQQLGWKKSQVFWHTAHDEYVFSLGRQCCRSRNEKNEGNGSESY